MSVKIYVTQNIPEEGWKILKKAGKVDIEKLNVPPTKTEIIKNLRDCDGVLTQLTNKIDAEIMDSNPQLKVISNYAVGYDNIDIQAATARKIYVTNTPGVLTETTADLAWSLLMATARRIVEGDKYTRAGNWKGGIGIGKGSGTVTAFGS